MQRIVVGVDGSTGSLRALWWAAEEAKLRGAELDAVLAWRFPMVMAAPGVVVPTVGYDELVADAKARLEQAVRTLGDLAEGLHVEQIVVEGGAAQALVDCAQGADLVVVGSRGHGGFTGLLLGSVAQQVAHHAPCPVVIIPAER